MHTDQNTDIRDTVVTQEFDENTIDLRELFFRLLAKWKEIACCAVIGFVAAFMITKILITPLYESTAQVYALGRSDSVINFSDLQLGSSLTKDYVAVFDVWEVHDKVIETLDLDPGKYTYTALRKMLTISNPNDTRIIEITVTSDDPELAAAMANAYANVGSSYIAESMSTDKPNIMSSARVPEKPKSPVLSKNCIIGFLLGAFLMVGIVTVQTLLDDKVKTPEDIRKYVNLTTLAVVPIDDSRVKNQGSNSKQGGSAKHE